MLFLLGQTAITVADDVASHPYLFLSFLGGIFAALIGTIKVLLAFLERRMNEKFQQVEQHNTHQDGRLGSIESDIRQYDKHVAVGAKETAEIHASLGRLEIALNEHVRKEETTTWKKIDDLVASFVDMKLANEAAHATMTTGQVLLSTRMDLVEQRLPNGELKKMATAIEAIHQHLKPKKRSVRGTK